MKKLFSKKLTIYIVSIIFVLSLGLISTKLAANAQTDNSLANRLSGRILLEVESNGEAWYLNPNNNLRYYLGRPADAFNIMRSLGLGASNKDITNFLKSKAPSRLAGRILLQVEDKGQAYYINPLDLKLHYLGRPADAFNVMRNLGLGITNSNLNKIAKHEGQANNNTETIPKENTEIKVITQKPALMTNFTHIISLSASISKIDDIKEKGFLYDYTSDPNTTLTPTLENHLKKVIDSSLGSSITANLDELEPLTYPFIRAYVIDSNNNIIYGNIETIDSVGKKGTPAMPISNSGSGSGSTSQVPDEEEGEDGEGDGEDGSGDEEGDDEEEPEVIQYTLTYTASEGGYVKLNDYPEWEGQNNLPFAIAGSAHLPIDDTKIFIAGGMTSDMTATSTVVIYDTELMEYEYLNPMNGARAAHSIAKIGDKIYVINGLQSLASFIPIHSTEVYDLNTGQWEYVSSTNIYRSAAVAVTYNNEIYSFGGFNASLLFSDYIEKYDSINNQWEIISSSTPVNSVSFRSAELIGDVLYFAGGTYKLGFDSSNEFSSYNFLTGEWNVDLPVLPEGRTGGSLSYINDKLLYFGGNSSVLSNASDYTFEYDFNNNEWRRIFNIPHTLSFSIIENIGDHVYIIGGFNDEVFYDTIYKIEKSRLFFVENQVQQIVFTGDETVEVYAIPENGYEFTMWSDQYGNYVRKDDIAALTEENVILTAFFELYTPEFNDPNNDLVLVFSVDAGETLTLPVKDGLATPYSKDGYNFLVNWGDGDISHVNSYNDPDINHTYSEATTTEIRITGKFPWIYFNNNVSSSKDNLLEVVQWGDVGFISFQDAFFGCLNLSTLPNGPITGAERVENFSSAFQISKISSISGDLLSNIPNLTNLKHSFSGNQLTELPTGLFNNNLKIVNFLGTFDGNNISSIPSGLFDNTTKVTNFSQTFVRNNISSIPSGLFDNTTKVTNFSNTFSRNNLSSIPIGLFNNNSNVISFRGIFQDNSITSIPSGLFDSNPLVTDFSLTFNNNEITSIPENLFASTTKVVDFTWTFLNNNLNSIPENLFANTPDVTSFYYTFGINNITSIPSGLFSNNTKVTNFSNTFSRNNLSSIPDGLFDNNPLVTTFYYVFSENYSLTGPAPALWLRDPLPIGTGAFYGATNLSNYADIPAGWK